MTEEEEAKAVRLVSRVAGLLDAAEEAADRFEDTEARAFVRGFRDVFGALGEGRLADAHGRVAALGPLAKRLLARSTDLAAHAEAIDAALRCGLAIAGGPLKAEGHLRFAEAHVRQMRAHLRSQRDVERVEMDGTET